MDLINKLRALNIVKKGNFNLTSAKTSDIYVDMKKAYGDPEALSIICDGFLSKISPSTTCIAGTGHGGVPIASIISQRSKLPLILVRAEPRKHGTQALIDGYVPTPSDKVSIIDDVLTTGKSLQHIIDAIKPLGATILGCHVVVNREEGANVNAPVSQLLFLKDLIGEK